jgi:RNA-directed DNA polymerase
LANIGEISPLLSNIFLHEILDKWYENEVKPRMTGKSYLIRFADDAVLGFENKHDAERVMKVLPKRFERYGLSIHPNKTKMFMFKRPCGKEDKETTTFDYLGFTHYWGKSRKGYYVIKKKTAKSRLSRAIKEISLWCKANRHIRIIEQRATLVKKVNGHYGYYGITGNSKSLQQFYYQVITNWKNWLNRRSRERNLTWDKMNLILKRHPLPTPKIVHSIYSAKL